MSAIVLCFRQQVQSDPDARTVRLVELINATIPHTISAHSKPSHVSPYQKIRHW